MWQHEKDELERMVYLAFMDGQKSFSITGEIKGKNSDEFKRVLKSVYDVYDITIKIKTEESKIARWKLKMKKKLMTLFRT